MYFSAQLLYFSALWFLFGTFLYFHLLAEIISVFIYSFPQLGELAEHSGDITWCHTPESQGLRQGSFAHVWCPGFYICCLGFCSCSPRDTPWLPHCGSQGVFHSWVLWNCDNWRNGSWKGISPRALQCGGLRHTPHSFCEGGLFASHGASAWGAGFRLGTHLVAYGT